MPPSLGTSCLAQYCPEEDHGRYDRLYHGAWDWQNPFTAYNCTWGFHYPTLYPEEDDVCATEGGIVLAERGNSTTCPRQVGAHPTANGRLAHTPLPMVGWRTTHCQWQVGAHPTANGRLAHTPLPVHARLIACRSHARPAQCSGGSRTRYALPDPIPALSKEPADPSPTHRPSTAASRHHFR